MTRRNVIPVFLTLLFLLAVVGQVQADGQQVDRPFTMRSVEWVVSEAPSANCPFGEVTVEGTGAATHMGAVTIYRTHCFSPFSDPPIVDGYWEAHAANGDMIWGHYTGSLIPTEFDDQGNPIRGQIISPYTVEGGTGRFAGASGGGMSIGDYNLVTDTGEFVTTGRLAY